MDANQKKFNIYVFLSTFARNLIELFIPIVLYKSGFNLTEVIFYFLLTNIFSFALCYPGILFANKFGNKALSIIGIIAFLLLQLMLGNVTNSIYYLLIVSFLFALYRRGYWIPRRYYNLKIIHKDNISTTYSIVTIVNQLGLVISSYVGALFLDFLNINYLTILAIVLFLVSLIPLCFMNFEHKETGSKIEIFNTMKAIPKRDLFLFGTYEIWYVVKFLFPIYLFMYVKDTYQTVGLLSLVTNLATIFFAYIYGKKINKDKNYLRLSIIFMTVVYLLKLNVFGVLLAIVSFLEGIFSKMYEISVQKEFYDISKKFEYHSYNCVYDINQNIYRIIVSLILLFMNDVRWMIIVSLLVMFSGIFVSVKKVNKKDYVKE